MAKMIARVSVLLMVLTVVGCKKDIAPTSVASVAAKDKFDEIVDELARFKDATCACSDAPCADKVHDEWRAYRKAMKEKVGKDAKPSDAQDARGRMLYSEMRSCRDRTNAARTDIATSALRKMGEFKESMCECPDRECAEKVNADMTKWAQNMAKEQGAPPPLSEADQKAASEMATAMVECLQKAKGN